MSARTIWNPTEHGLFVLIPVIGLVGMGLASIHAIESNSDANIASLAIKQFVFLLASIGIMTATLLVSYQRIGRSAYGLFALTLGLLALLLVDKWAVNLPFIEPRYGAWRWIQVGGFQIQPSELMKVVFILSLARYLQFRRNYRRLGGLMGPFVLTLVPMFLILPEPDLGTVLLLLPVFLVMLFAAGARLRHFLLMLGLAVCALPLVWRGMHGYQQRRISAVVMQSRAVREKVMGLTVKLGPQPELERDLRKRSLSVDSRKLLLGHGITLDDNVTVATKVPTWQWTLTDRDRTYTIRRGTQASVSFFNVYHSPTWPWAWLGTPRQAREWDHNDGYQLQHAMIALGSGGWFGWENDSDSVVLRGGYIPHLHNDFIFAVIGHRWGFVGALLVIGCYVMIAIGGVEIAVLTNDPFGRLLAIGVVTLISAQALINIGISLGLMPTTGMTLPFVSYGGSSLLVNFIAVGLLINIAQRRPMVIGHKPFSFHDEDDE